MIRWGAGHSKPEAHMNRAEWYALYTHALVERDPVKLRFRINEGGSRHVFTNPRFGRKPGVEPRTRGHSKRAIKPSCFAEELAALRPTDCLDNDSAHDPAFYWNEVRRLDVTEFAQFSVQVPFGVITATILWGVAPM